MSRLAVLDGKIVDALADMIELDRSSLTTCVDNEDDASRLEKIHVCYDNIVMTRFAPMLRAMGIDVMPIALYERAQRRLAERNAARERLLRERAARRAQ
ncbi:hypothetical protein F1188_16220 [Roseospira marina]|uniref:Uncharacterized protein n=1 Tax=Roseospira marina TaxID=140057 RepID=A0A5M6I9K2_9PROT|nr:hypothetical protein [Roseospira marina]KAA5604405.1 hypothetical protein F1188_16220 [Roseospira marina]MBB4315402.1 hypothetical protein [Roseospira marina]MBB5088453.1 hypothetical protein [Roseospira marina]